MIPLLAHTRLSKRRWFSRLWPILAACTLVLAVWQVVAEPQATVKDEKKTRAGTQPTSSKRVKGAIAPTQNGHGRLRPFYDVSFHSVSDPSAIHLSDYLVNESFWGRRPSLVIATPISPNVLQPDEAYAEATTETLLRQIGADLGVRDTTEQVTKTLDFLKKLRDKARRTADAEPEKSQREPAQPTPTEKPAAAPSSESAQPDARGLRTVQLIVLPDTRPIWNGMTVYDRTAVAERSLNEYLKKVPAKRARLLEYLEPDQFRFGAFLGKDAVNQLMDGLGVRRPEFHVLVMDRDANVVGMWNKFNLDPKQVSATYRQVAKEVGENTRLDDQ